MKIILRVFLVALISISVRLLFICLFNSSMINSFIINKINSENYDKTIDFIKRSKAHVAFGHLEVAGFAMYKGYNAEDGIAKDVFKGYEIVCSGHYHHKSSKDNIHYLGAPYEITWNDYDDPRGFHVFDTETREIEFIRNKFRLFESFQLARNPFSLIKATIVKVRKRVT